mmetsp:Transcript_10523/g.28812  ORF Transcript_10523/g.28812 Transcript_10523/m.28812 type:complete len:215 (+) Transcript_10523:1317-1961(+)
MTETGSMPSSKSCSRSVTSSRHCSRTSRPSRVRAAVLVMRLLNSSLKSTTPSSPQLAKYCSASITNWGTYIFKRSFFRASVNHLNCSVRTFRSTSYTTPGPKVGTLKEYTSVWLISSSVALKKWGATSGPMRKVMRLLATGTVKASPSLVYPSCISFMGLSLVNLSRPPMKGRPSKTGGACPLPTVFARYRPNSTQTTVKKVIRTSCCWGSEGR